MIRRLLVANRGEIALRVFRACRTLGLGTVAVFSEADKDAPHVRDADRAVLLGPAPARESYLDIERLLDAARQSGADAIHPGYGFLSENWRFAEAVTRAGLTFVGPPAEAVRAMGDKTQARRLMAAAGVPTVPGSPGPIAEPAEAEALASAIGFPLVLKAAGGGGGSGMARVDKAADLAAAFAAATRRAQSAFGNPAVYVERYLERPRHVEVQVFADAHGTVVHLHERECSIQRRHQKLIEESPAPNLPPATKRGLTEAAVAGARAIGYVNAGTMEFLVDAAGGFHFLEMNTRIQVEHPVTEEVTGLDLVVEQLRVAAGERLSWRQEDIAQRVGRKQSTISNTLRLLSAPQELQDAVVDGHISEGHLRALLPLGAEQARLALRQVMNDRLNVRQTEALVRRLASAPRRRPLRDPEVERAQDELRAALGTKVQIKRGRRGGRITIEFYSAEEFERLYELLQRAKSD